MKVREIIGWSALLGAVTAMTLFLGSMLYSPKSSMKNKSGKDFSVFERVFTPKTVTTENRQALEESISKKLVEIAKEKRDSIAAVKKGQDDSIKKAIAVMKMKPRSQPIQNKRVRLPQKH